MKRPMTLSLVTALALIVACGGDAETTTTPPEAAATTTTVATTTTATTAAPTTTTATTTTGSSGGHDLNGDEQALADAIAASMLDTGTPLTQDQAQCFGDGVVAALGLDRLTEVGLSVDAIQSGVTPDDVDLSDEELTAMVDAMFDCVDVASLFVSGLASGVDLSDSSMQCLEDGIDADLLRPFIAATVKGEQLDPTATNELVSAVFGLMANCLTPEELGQLTGTGGG